ncbi:MAG TPA: hypothetical protein VM055_01210 [Novosphingobium sp.]|nr:hypothetical protein [Novosphingobium sp.]
MAREAEIVADAREGRAVIGWKLDRGQRTELLKAFPPKFAAAVADHVTLKAKVADDTPLPRALPARIVARADDGRGVEAMVVEIDGSSARPGGGTYHVTWSLGEGRRANESNDVLASRPWRRLDAPVALALRPARFE